MYLYIRARQAGNLDAQARWTPQLTWEIVRHAITDEFVVYPLMEEHLGRQAACGP